MNTTRKCLTICLLIGSICYAETPEAAPGKVKVYIYPAPTSSGYYFKVYSDQTLIANVGKKYYFTTDLEPGRHLFYPESNVKNGVTANLTLGHEYFLQCADSSAAHRKVMLGRTTIGCTLVDPDQGKSDIEKLNPAPGPANAPLKELK